MNLVSKRTTLLAISLVIFSWWFYRPFPEGLMGPDRWKIQTFVHILRLFGLIPKIFSRLSLKTPFVKITRFNEQIMPHGKPDSSDVKYYDTVMVGVPVRVYVPDNRQGRGAVVFFHGGGWWMCNVESHHAAVYEMSSRAQKIFLSVEYRRAPEHLFPAAVEDSESVVRYFLDEGYKQFNVGPDEIAVAGDSAGGNLAAVVAQHLNDQPASHKLKAQLLAYPILQMANTFLPSYRQANIYGESTFITPRAAATSMMLYIGLPLRYSAVVAANEHVKEEIRETPLYQYIDQLVLPLGFANKPVNVSDLRRRHIQSGFPVKDIATVRDALQPYLFNPSLNPLHKSNLTGLPTSYFILCGFDPLRDEGYIYAKRLESANISVTIKYYEYTLHGVLSLVNTEYGKVVMNDLVSFIQKTIT